MNIHQTPQSKAADHELNACLSNAAPDEPLKEVTTDLRLARILDYEAESLAKPVALEACVGLSNGTLMQIGCRLADVINATTAGLNIENFSRVQPMMDTYLRVMRQVDRYSHLAAELTESRRKAEEKKPLVQATALRGLSKSAASSKRSTTPSSWS
jgi:hypothetical protein